VRSVRTVRIVERLLATGFLMVAIAIFVFFVMRYLPGDPVDLIMGQEGNVPQEQIDALRRQYGLDQPLFVQLGNYLRNLVRGDLGTSVVQRRAVHELLLARLPATIELSLGAIIVAVVIAVPVGVVSAYWHNSAVDRVSMAITFIGVSMPPFWLGIVLIIVVSAQWQLLPVGGRIEIGLEPAQITGLYVVDSLLTGNSQALFSSLKHLILPSVTLGAPVAAVLARVLRSSMLDALAQDYVRLARAKGADELIVVLKHAFRNALIPSTTILGLEVGSLLGGNMIVETVFSWPGIGRLTVESIFARDYVVVQGVVMVYVFIFVLVNFLVDIAYTLLNPRITL